MKMVSFALVIDVVGKVPASTFIVFVVCLFILVVLDLLMSRHVIGLSEY